MQTFRSLTVALLLLAVLSPVSPADGQDGSGRTPARLSLMDGEVSYFPKGGDDWEHAQRNLPLNEGDYVATGPNSRAEIQVSSSAFLRFDGESEAGIDVFDSGLLRLDVVSGRVAFDARRLPAGVRVEISTRFARLSVSEPGVYDVRVYGSAAEFAIHQGGRAIVSTDDDSLTVSSGDQVTARSGERLFAGDADRGDDFLAWSSQRTDRILASTSRRYVSEDVYGLEDLDAHGEWRRERDYGYVWYPREVSVGWAPYSTGRWFWDPFYGWTWVDTVHWGWAPFHYGRWVRVRSHWAWAPGPRVIRPVYAPALVAFFGGGGGVRVGVSVGVPFVSWVPLGWGEPIYPWWGPTHYRRRPCWDGWGGPTIINNVYVDRRKVDARTEIHYHHRRDRDAVVVVRRDDFGRRTVDRVRIDQEDHRRMRPMRGEITDVPRPAATRERARGERPRRPEQVVDLRTRERQRDREPHAPAPSQAPMPSGGKKPTSRRSDPWQTNRRAYADPESGDRPHGTEPLRNPEREPHLDRGDRSRPRPPAASGGAPPTDPSVDRSSGRPESRRRPDSATDEPRAPRSPSRPPRPSSDPSERMPHRPERQRDDGQVQERGRVPNDRPAPSEDFQDRRRERPERRERPMEDRGAPPPESDSGMREPRRVREPERQRQMESPRQARPEMPRTDPGAEPRRERDRERDRGDQDRGGRPESRRSRERTE